MTPSQAAYLQSQIENHITLFFTVNGAEVFSDDYVAFLPFDKATETRGPRIVIPYDMPAANVADTPRTIAFNNTRLTHWNRISPPDAASWKAVPDDTAPLWYRHQSGTLMPAWNLFGNLFHLLTYGEEARDTRRDHHGRYAAAFSSRLPLNLLEVPAFNEAVAAIVAAWAGLRENGRPRFDLDGLLKPPLVVLSHDCDILLGNDLWTQSVRAARIILPLARLRPPRLSNIWWILRNTANPRKYYFDNAVGMIDLERCFGYNSTFYMLNGSGGRFGARSGLAIIPELQKQIPAQSDIGIHYNYDTFLDEDRFKAQIDQLQTAVAQNITVGRAHYLKFDPAKSFEFLEQYGIYADESSGYPDRIGYRNGIAGCFRAYDTISGKPHDIWEIPLTIMDAVLVAQYGKRAIEKFSELINHLRGVGGALSIVFHPGQFFNPEHKQLLGVYHKMLIECRQAGAESRTALSLVDKIR